MIKKYINLLILIFFSWKVYSTCQEDSFLPIAGLGILVLSVLLRLKSYQKSFEAFNKIPLSIIIIVSIIAGFFYKGLYPPPEGTFSPFPELTAALQAGSIIATIFIWLKPFTKENIVALTFLAWLTVALSINVMFDQTKLFIFCSFCIVATAMIILQIMKVPQDRRYIFSYYRDFTVYSALLVLITTGLFYTIAQSIVIFDKAFMSFMHDYVIPSNYTHFLKMDPQLSLTSPGRSAWDRRPVLEIEMPDTEGLYLRTQVFKDFNDGTWAEIKNENLTVLPRKLNKRMINGKLTMFTSFDEIIPAPNRMQAAKGSALYSKSKENIVFTDEKRRTHMLSFSVSPVKSAVKLTQKEFEQYTSVPPDIDSDLTEISASITGSEGNPAIIADKVKEYFHENFLYSLVINYKADNEGIVKMIRNKKPAYCSYFATAMTLLLRAHNIPARVATGFMTNEIIDKRTNKFLARVNNAHAWTEVLLPETDRQTGQVKYTWELFDPTPSNELAQTLKLSSWMKLRSFAERIWIGLLRFRAFVENVDKDKMKIYLLFTLIFVMAIINRNKLFHNFKNVYLYIKLRSLHRAVKPNIFHSIYHRYEQYLQRLFKESRRPTDTDSDVLKRLKKRSDIPQETIARIESFLSHYHAARFGGKREVDLNKVIKAMEETN